MRPNDSLPASLVALIDYDNAKPSGSEVGRIQVESNLVSIVDRICQLLGEWQPGIFAEVACMFYGGWIDENGRFSQRGNWALQSLSTTRGIFHGIRVNPSLKLCPEKISSTRLVGTVRRQKGALVQKMVDTMLSLDAIHFASISDSLIIASDDDDILPSALVASAASRCRVNLVRSRALGEGMNDGAVSSHGVRIDQTGW